MALITFDGGDLDRNEHWYLDGLCCIECRREVHANLAPASPLRMYDVELCCRECLGPVSPAFDQFSGQLRTLSPVP